MKNIWLQNHKNVSMIKAILRASHGLILQVESNLLYKHQLAPA